MTTTVKHLDVPVAEGRTQTTDIAAVNYAEQGFTVYGCTLGKGGETVRLLSVPVQNAPYALEGSAQGLPLEALYAILKDQLQVERHTVSPAKAEMLDACIGLLDGSRDILLGVNAVPQPVGEIHA